MTYNREKYLRQYYSKPPEAVVYILKILDKPIFKVGSSTRIQERMKNLSQAMYEEAELHTIIPCCCRHHAMTIEKQLHTALSTYRLRREWYSCEEKTMLDNISVYIGNGHECLPTDD